MNTIEDRYLEDLAFSCMNCEFIQLLKFTNMSIAGAYELKQKLGYVPKMTKQEQAIINQAVELRLK